MKSRHICLRAALPDVTIHDVTLDHEFVVLACDGIWDVLSSQEVVDFVRVRVAQQMEPEVVSKKSYCASLLPDICVNVLCVADATINWCQLKNVVIFGLQKALPTRYY